VAYAYDDRWNRMSLGDFFKRRLVRLQPMVVIGTAIGAYCRSAGHPRGSRYDEPLRAWLGQRFLSKKSGVTESQSATK